MSAFEDSKVAELGDTDDWQSAWEECKKQGLKWGGRGMGGRATGRCTVQTRDIVVEGCTMSYLGNNLLNRTTLRLLHGKIYGLIGRNGVGKSTLFQRMYTGTLPGFPPHIAVSLVQQELPNVSDPTITAVDYILQSDPHRNLLLKRIQELEDSECGSSIDAEEQANMLSSLYDLIEDEGLVRARAIKTLKELGFSETRRQAPLLEMSGGWKMRVSIAAALVQEPDLLLLDEPTNHMDVEGVEWLKSYILGPAAAKGLTVVVISHDRCFLDDVCTDIIRFFGNALAYFPGNYSAYEETKHDMDLHANRAQELIDKQRKAIETSIQKMQVVASKGESKMGAIASRHKKLNRLGMEKNIHGHRFRAQHEATAGRNSIRAGSINETAMGYKTGESRSLMEQSDRETRIVFPNPVPLTTFGPLISLRQVSVAYCQPGRESTPVLPATASSSSVSGASTTASAASQSNKAKSLKQVAASKGSNKSSVSTSLATAAASGSNSTNILAGITLDIEQKAKIAILGRNGCGKSTLMRLLVDCDVGSTVVGPVVASSSVPVGGTSSSSSSTDSTASPIANSSTMRITSGEVIKMRSGLKIAYFQQNLQESLPYDATPLLYLTSLAPSEAANEQSVRSHLASFGICGDLVSRQIGTLSGGQKSRIVLAQLTINKPNLLLLDEPTNNLDLDAVQALSTALQNYEGAVVVASHDLAFVDEIVESDHCYRLFKGSLALIEGGVLAYQETVMANVESQRRTLS